MMDIILFKKDENSKDVNKEVSKLYFQYDFASKIKLQKITVIIVLLGSKLNKP